MVDDTIRRLTEKAEFFQLEACLVHVSFKNGKWLNGYIEDINEDKFVLNERKQGKCLVFFDEINEIESYNYDRKEGGE